MWPVWLRNWIPYFIVCYFILNSHVWTCAQCCSRPFKILKDDLCGYKKVINFLWGQPLQMWNCFSLSLDSVTQHKVCAPENYLLQQWRRRLSSSPKVLFGHSSDKLVKRRNWPRRDASLYHHMFTWVLWVLCKESPLCAFLMTERVFQTCADSRCQGLFCIMPVFVSW